MKSQSSLATLALATVIFCAGHDDARPSEHSPLSHAPIGVMGDHTHQSGEWMFSYRYSRMHMEDNRDGTDRLSTAEVLQDYMVAPLEMDMEMHMFGAMYGFNDDLTFMAMVPYVSKEMEHITRMGQRFTTETEGLGDIKVTGLYDLYEQKDSKLILQAGVSLPTGAIDERDDTPAQANAFLPYAMQLGSGTFDPILGLSYSQHLHGWGWGAKADTTLRLYDNDEDYHLGNAYKVTAWAANQVTDVMSVSLRLEGSMWEDVDGANPALNPRMVPTARTDLRGGQRIDALIGANLVVPDGHAEGHRLAFEFGIPVYQDLDGPQLETDYRFQLGWQYAF